MIKLGAVLNISAEAGRSDTQVLHEHMALGDMVEPLGFDSLFVLEHHFSDYVISPDPFQLLAYYAGRTKRILLGTAVIVLPWHNPVRVAGQVSLLDAMCHGRCIFAFGRGLGLSEFQGLGVPMSQSRGRFLEAAEIVVGCLTNDVFEYSGEYYKVPPLSIRPKPSPQLYERFYGSSNGQESAKMIAKLGFGMLVSTQKPWATLGKDAAAFRKIASDAGHSPRGPIVVAVVSVDSSARRARDRADEYFSQDLAMIDAHYGFSEGIVPTIPGYESYASTQGYFSRLSGCAYKDQDYSALQITGTPEDCATQIMELYRFTGLEHLLLEFSYGGMPITEARRNMEVFAENVIPLLRDKGVPYD